MKEGPGNPAAACRSRGRSISVLSSGHHPQSSLCEPLRPTETVTVPPVIVVAVTDLTNRAIALELVTTVVVDAALVVTAEPTLNQFVPSKLPCIRTYPKGRYPTGVAAIGTHRLPPPGMRWDAMGGKGGQREGW